MAETDIYLDDYFDDFMDVASDEDLIKEIEKRGHKVYKKEIPITPFGEQPIEFYNPTDLKGIYATQLMPAIVYPMKNLSMK